MSIEPQTLKQILELPAADMVDLAETVGVSMILNGPLSLSQTHKLSAAASMMSTAIHCFEQCGCKIDTVIAGPMWTHNIRYKTGDKS